ncbi:hypothetical protein QWY86_03890 [Pedobacter aquatilis]|uniref:hypothetical protein n=1 Tax=Pedobacter aquatilis TaxID=351343 RepID=UPI0025B3E1D7|nr:hypothetical protein [Pedobacter aquatilis]MDN3585794.1 hypothetical protein [Pedobacter aquatilis]
MDKFYEIDNYRIKVSLDDGLIRLKSDKALWLYLDGGSISQTLKLVRFIKTDYEATFEKQLNISDNSLTVEIWAHVYSHYFGLLLNKYNNIKWLKKILLKGIERAEIIDCGEKYKDTNRWFWDLISGLKRQISWFLPKNIGNEKLIS